MQIDQPLNPQKIQELSAFLSSDATPAECMDAEMLHGFLTAVVIGPDMIMPSEWMPYIWQGEEPEFETQDQVAYITTLIMRLYNGISQSCQDGTFQPLLHDNGDEGDWCNEGRCWADGFVLGQSLGKWRPLLQSSDAQAFMPIMVLGAPIDDPTVEGPAGTPEKRRTVIGHLPEAVRIMHAYWVKWRKSAYSPDMGKILPFRKPPALGRNEPCPCGSGRKYKKCCGTS